MSSFSRLLIKRIITCPSKPLNDTVIIAGHFRRRFLSSSRSFDIKRKDPVIMILDSPEFKALFTPELTALADIFKKYNYEIRIAGGAVRDLLMGKQPKDLDFATVATPEEMREMFTKEEIRMINPKGESHGTITPRINDKENFEVTTLRIDVETDGRHAKVQFTQDWLLDANRRDLTINSMFLGLDGTVYDYFNGYEDLQKRLVKFVGNPEDRIREDYLRILRYFRFFGRIADNPSKYDEESIAVIQANVSGLGKIAGERIWSEVRLILSGNHGPCIFEKMLSTGMGPFIGLPEEPNIAELQALIDRTGDTRLNPVAYLAAVLNNSTEAVSLNNRLRMSSFERELALFIVENREEKLCPKPLLPFQKIMLHTKFKVSDVREWCVQVLLYNGQYELAQEMKEWIMPKLPVTGIDLKEHVTQSKQMALVVTKLKDYWADNDFKPEREELISQIPKVVEEIVLTQVERPKPQHKKKK